MIFFRHIIIGLFLLLMPEYGFSYPMDGHTYTGITRLKALELVHEGKMKGPKRVYGARLPLEKTDIRLPGTAITMPAPDQPFTDQIIRQLGEAYKGYSIALLDLTRPDRPRYAAINDNRIANPGSVGKIIVALSLFQALHDVYPDDVEKRMDILKNTQVTADEFIHYDHHKVPIWKEGDSKITYRPIQMGDSASLITYLDWMMSASSNAAAAMIQREVMLIRTFKKEYPVSLEKQQFFFNQTPKKELGRIFLQSIREPITKNDMDIKTFHQGSFFTRTGKRKIPGARSYASPKALVNFLFKLEQGQIVDTFSSREIKRFLYMTGRRIRYASSPALYPSAVYFKSGSFYKCKPEEGFTCRKYRGNVLNQLASIAIVEHPAKGQKLHYLVAVMSNVLYVNSAVAHQTLATKLQHLLADEYNLKKTP